MPDTHSTLNGLFTDIADAIREKDGSTGTKLADAFPAAIRAIPTGGGGDTDIEDALIEGTISEYTNPRVSVIRIYAFRSCYNLTTISFPTCTAIGSWAFGYCPNLTTASFPVCTTIGNYAFSSCARLTTVSFPVCKTIDTGAFCNCYSLTTASFPSCTAMGYSAFSGCSNLITVSFPACTTISSYAFYMCSKLTSLFILASSVCQLGASNAFTSTPMVNSTYLGRFGSIFVPASLVSAYKTATNWTYYAARITAAPEGI